jgi:hypothetical protein
MNALRQEAFTAMTINAAYAFVECLINLCDAHPFHMPFPGPDMGGQNEWARAR